jgi:two-component system, chemotaxis family, sensor histidine kinase and response regulator PixL
MNPQRTILVIEDEPFLQAMISTLLTDRGFRVLGARSVVQAIEYLVYEQDIAAIWLDHFVLGEENGIDFMAHVTEHPGWAEIPIFVVSGSDSKDREVLYRKLGAKGFFKKTEYTIEEIVSWIADDLGAERLQHLDAAEMEGVDLTTR